ncbi:MAG: hypothetical protein HY821_01760 [Acidobacteria bacterium]|nr:hypothetical protein [Acidobacteriota bacterium]
MFARSNLRARLTAGSAVLVATSLVLGSFSVWALRRMTHTLHDVVESAAEEAESAEALLSGFHQMRSWSHAAQISVVIGHLNQQSKRAAECAACHDSSMIRQNRARFREAAGQIQDKLSMLASLPLEETQRGRVEQLRRSLPQWLDADERYHQAAAAGRFDDAHAIVEKQLQPLVQQHSVLAAGLESAARQRRAAALESIDEEAGWLLGLVALAALLSLASGTGVARALWQAGRRLSALISELDQSVGIVVNSGQNLAQTSQQLAQNAARQERAFVDTVTESRSVTELARSNNQHSGSADETAARASERTAQARQALHQMQESMEGVHRSSEQIANIIKIIDGIAFQTNILALNAAVEAARAGESGMGFAVVAGEVRTLAQRSAEAARETSSLIEELRQRAAEGQARVQTAVESVDEIAFGAEQVRTLVGRVRAGSADQAAGMERLAQSLTAIESSTSATARSADETASESEELRQTSARLAEAVQDLGALLGAHAVT